jgi:hypothetical protein
MAGDFISYKDKRSGAVTLTKRGGKYDDGSDPNYPGELGDEFRGIGGSASAETIAKDGKEKGQKEAEDTARVTRGMSAKAKANNASMDPAGSCTGKGSDHEFFKHTITNK